MAKTFWNSKTAEYVDKSGKAIDYKEVRSAVDAVADDASVRLRQIYNANKTNISEWVTQSESLLKKLYGSTAQIASGGREAMTPSLNGQLGARTRFQLSHFKQFWLQVEKGELSDAAILARLDMYADASVGVFEQMRQNVMLKAGYTEALNVLGDAKHCADCPRISGLGWIPISDMPPVGARACMSKDRCTVQYR